MNIPMLPEGRAARAALARAVRNGAPQDEVDELRREYRRWKLLALVHHAAQEMGNEAFDLSDSDAPDNIADELRVVGAAQLHRLRHDVTSIIAFAETLSGAEPGSMAAMEWINTKS